MDSKFPVCPECASHSQPGRARTRARTSNDHRRRSPTTLVALIRGAAPDTKRRRRRTRGSPSKWITPPVSKSVRVSDGQIGRNDRAHSQRNEGDEERDGPSSHAGTLTDTP